MIKSRFNAFLADHKGGVIIYVALAMPVLVGGMGLGAESGYRYHNQRLLQHAADFAAHAGAVRKYKGDEKADIDTAATHVAVSSDYDDSVGTITVNIPPASGAFTGDPSAVEVILTETRPRLFSAIFSKEPVLIGARAVAAANGPAQPACILALSETAPAAVEVTGSTSVNLVGCSVASNSTATNSFNMKGMGGSLTADCVQSSGGSNTTTNLTLTECDQVLNNAPPVADPYYWVQEPPDTIDPCPNTNGKGKGSGRGNKDFDYVASVDWNHPSGEVVKVMRFCNGLKAQGDITFEPGIYIIDSGDFTANATAKLTSKELAGTEGVTFFLTNGAEVKFNGTATLDLQAPESGPTSGILFFGDRSDSVDHKILGNAGSELTGAIYMPAAHVQFTGNSKTASGCTQVIANTITLTGNSALAIDCDDDGTEEIFLGNLIAVVE